MILDRLDRLEKREAISVNDWYIRYGEDNGYEGLTDGLNEQNYYSCLNILSNSIAKLPLSIKQDTDLGEIDIKNHYLWDMLRLRANVNMNSFECIKALILMYKHYGCSGLYINRIGNKIEGLYPVRITNITIDNIGLIKSTKNNKILIDFRCGDVEDSCFDGDIIILRDNSLDGIKFNKTKSYIKDTLNSSIQAQKYQTDLFSNGLTSKAVVQITSDIKDEKELSKIQEKFQRLYSSKGRIFTVPAGFNISSLNLDLVQSQFAELRTMSKKDICNAIGIPFNLLENGFLTEQENISFLTNTLLPIIIQLEQELNYKLLNTAERKKGYKIQFNINSMLRTNAETQKNIICDYVKNGVYSLEYARKILGVYGDFKDETVSLPSGQVLLKDLINGNASWQKNKGGEEA